MDGSAFRGVGDALVAVFFIAIVGAILSIILGGFILWGWFTAPDWQAEAIERGYALYCPGDGSFAWIGECP